MALQANRKYTLTRRTIYVDGYPAFALIRAKSEYPETPQSLSESDLDRIAEDITGLIGAGNHERVNDTAPRVTLAGTQRL